MVAFATNSAMLEAAIDLHEREIGITLCKGKKPIRSRWHKYTYTVSELEETLGRNDSLNIGIILGNQSGIVDFEGDDESSEADLLELFEGDIPRTPTYQSQRGLHRLFKWDDRLADLGKTVVKYGTVEIRTGAGGAAQSLIPPSRTGDFERKWLVSLDECEPVKIPDYVIEKIRQACSPAQYEEFSEHASTHDGDSSQANRPGDDFNLKGEWDEILIPHGWHNVGSSNKASFWKRPGKVDAGHSATTGFCSTNKGKELFHCFSDKASPFEQGRSYDKFAAYALLNNGGDFSAAAADLASQGFGETKAKPKAPSVATQLVDLALSEGVELFHTPEKTPFATAPVSEHFETWATDGEGFKYWLELLYFRTTGKAVAANAIKEAVSLISAKALFDGDTLPVFTRTGSLENKIYLDLGNKHWNAIEIDSEGWRLCDQPPIKFVRPDGVLSLPTPTSGGSIDLLRRFVNVTNDQLVLLVSAMVAALRPTGPYPVITLSGEQGSSKSTTAKLIKSLIDPNQAPLRCQPKSDHDLMISATNSHFLVFDNLSTIKSWFSDALCRISTGGGYACRRLYSGRGEEIFNVVRPTLLTGIENPAKRSDLLNRTLMIELQAIPKESRKAEEELWSEFEKVRPLILGALLDGVAKAIKNSPTTVLDDSPRMADFAKWATAAETSFGWSTGTFMEAYRKNELLTNEEALQHPLATEIQKLLESENPWQGTPTELLEKLSKSAGEQTVYSPDWPKSASAMSGKLTRITPNLRLAGIEIIHTREGSRREITLSRKS